MKFESYSTLRAGSSMDIFQLGAPVVLTFAPDIVHPLLGRILVLVLPGILLAQSGGLSLQFFYNVSRINICFHYKRQNKQKWP